MLFRSAGGHTGSVGAFALVEEIRRFFDGPLVLGGGIGSGRAIRAAQVLGADLAYMGTRFLATTESMVSEAQKRMLVASGSGDIVCSDAFTGVNANWLRQSIVDAGLDPDALPRGEVDFSRQGPLALERTVVRRAGRREHRSGLPDGRGGRTTDRGVPDSGRLINPRSSSPGSPASGSCRSHCARAVRAACGSVPAP